ncbi:unnamed protein product [Arctogadus glacialis]
MSLNSHRALSSRCPRSTSKGQLTTRPHHYTLPLPPPMNPNPDQTAPEEGTGGEESGSPGSVFGPKEIQVYQA